MMQNLSVHKPIAAPHGPFTGKHFLIIMVTFFATIVAVNATLAYFAISSWTGLVVPNSYVASQSFNEDTARRLEAVHAGAVAAVRLDKGYIDLVFTGRDGKPVEAAGLAAKLRHPVDAALDRSLQFEAIGPGHYRSADRLPKGAWLGDVNGEIAGYGHWAEAIRLKVED